MVFYESIQIYTEEQGYRHNVLQGSPAKSCFWKCEQISTRQTATYVEFLYAYAMMIIIYSLYHNYSSSYRSFG